MAALIPIPTQNSCPYTCPDSSPDVAHQPMFWVLITISSLILLAIILSIFSWFKLWVPLWPSTRVNIVPRTRNRIGVPEQTGVLVLSVPYLAWVSHGSVYNISLHSLRQFNITEFGADATIELADFHQPTSTTIPKLVVPACPPPIYIQKFIDRNNFHNLGVPLGLEFRAPISAFGPMVDIEVTEEVADYRPDTPVEVPPSPEVSIAYLTMGPPQDMSFVSQSNVPDLATDLQCKKRKSKYFYLL
ncbi:hypothetical protein FRC12_014347 [Ceratobasidium sp. 428]|nr:hypothetical protein FRC12_014347 [Ceratobasidium sp. 428]